jgi:predicted nucleic acid-binding protein
VGATSAVSSETLDHALQGVGRILLDSSVILAYVNTHEVVHTLALHLFARIADKHDTLRGCYSAVSVTECLVRPIQAGIQAVSVMSALLQAYPNFDMIPIDYAVGERAAHVRVEANLRLPDALIVATALVAGCGAVITNDDKWGRLAGRYPNVAWLYLDAFR